MNNSQNVETFIEGNINYTKHSADRQYGVSILIPCYNAGVYVEETVESINKQNIQVPYEIILVDDASTDVTTKRAIDNVYNSPFLSVITFNERQGAQKARNVALRHATYEYAFQIDADDLLNNEEALITKGSYADRAINLMKESPDIAFVHGMTKMFGEYNGYTSSAYPVSEELAVRKHHVSNAIVYKTEDAIQSGGYDESIEKWQDWSFGIRLLNYRLERGLENKIGFIEDPFYLYRVHNQNGRISHQKVDELAMTRITVENNATLFRKHYQGMTTDEIAEAVLLGKPDNLRDLLHISNNSLKTAFEYVAQRSCRLVTGVDLKIAP